MNDASGAEILTRLLDRNYVNKLDGMTADQKTQLKQMEANHEARMQKHMNQEAPAPPEQ